MPICHKCSRSFPNNIEIDGKLRNLQNRKFCLLCSPFKKHNTKNLLYFDSSFKRIFKKCCKCHENKSAENFYYNSKLNKFSSYCKPCYCQATSLRQNRFKEQCVNFKGGKCIKCGYDKCIAALEFHHRDENEKKFEIARAWQKGLTELVKTELQKCDLLCANCHREVHYMKQLPSAGLEPT